MTGLGTTGAEAAPATVLVAGATGLIGSALVEALRRRGHRVIAAARPRPGGRGPDGQPLLGVDLADPPDAAWWAERLRGVDVVVNAVGIFNERGRQTFDTLHTHGPVALFEGAQRAGASLVIQLSALGSDAAAATAYHRSKQAADEALRSLAIPSVIVQPSLVYAPAGPSARLFNRLAALPLWVLPRSAARVQPVHLDDLVEVLTRLVDDRPRRSFTLPAVGPEPLTLEAYLATLRTSLGWQRRAHVLRLPPGAVLRLAALAGRLPGSLIGPDAVRMLLRGNEADGTPFRARLGRAARPVADFVAAPERAEVARQTALANLQPLALLSLAAVWLWTGVVSLGLYPVEDSLALLADFGLHGTPARVALYAGALLDLAIGLATLLAPRRHLPRLLQAQAAVMLGYTLLITLRMPHWWLHPYGPLTKNLPMLALIGLLLVLHRRRP